MAQEPDFRLYFTLPLFPHLPNRRAASIFPGHGFWPLVRCRVSAAQPLSSKATTETSTECSRRPCLSCRSRRRTATAPTACSVGGRKNLRTPAPPWSVVASSGAWHDAAFRGYYAPLARRGDGRSESFRLGRGLGVGSRSRWYDTVLPGWAKPIDRSATAA